MINESEREKWDTLQDQFSENPSGFFKILQTIKLRAWVDMFISEFYQIKIIYNTIGEESGLKMFKAINLIKDEIVMIKELTLLRGQIDLILKISSSQTNKNTQQFEIKVFDKYLCKKTHENATIWIELEYCQMGSIHDIVQITKLAFSEGEIAFMIDQIIQYLLELQRDNQLKDQKPLLDSRHLFLTNQGVLKIFPFPLFSQQIKNENLKSELNKELIQLIGLMDNNISCNEDNFSEDIKKLVKALKEDSEYSSILNTKIIQENKDKFEYIKRSIYNTRKRAIENYRKTSMSKFVPDTLKNGNTITSTDQSCSKNNENYDLSSSQKKQSLDDYPDNYSENSPTNKDIKYNKDKQRQQNLRNNNIISKKNPFHQFQQFNELSQDLKDISQIHHFQNPYFSSLESNGSLCQYLMNSQLSIQSKNGNYPSFLFQSSGTGNIDFQNMNDLKSITDRRFDEEDKDIIKENDFPLQTNYQKDISNPLKKQDTPERRELSNENKKYRYQGIKNVQIRQFFENHSEKKLKVKILVKERKESDSQNQELQEVQKEQLSKPSFIQENNQKNQDNTPSMSDTHQIKQIKQQLTQNQNQLQSLQLSPMNDEQKKQDQQMLLSPDEEESNYSYDSGKISSRPERQFGQFEKEVVSLNDYKNQQNQRGDKEDFFNVQVQNDTIEEQSEITSSFPQSPDTNRRIHSKYENIKKYSPKIEYNDITLMNMKRMGYLSEEKKKQSQEKQNQLEFEHIENNSIAEGDQNKFVLQYVSNRQTYDSFEVSEVKSYQAQQYETHDQKLEDQEFNYQYFTSKEDLERKYDIITISSVNPQEYETFGGGSTTVAPAQEENNANNSERNQKDADNNEQIFFPTKDFQETFIKNDLPTSRCNHHQQINQQNQYELIKKNPSQQYFCGCINKIDQTNGQCEVFSEISSSDISSDELQQEESSIQSDLKEEWKMNEKNIFSYNGNADKREESINFLQKRYSEQIEMLPFQDQILNKRNSSPVSKISKKNESPKVELPSLMQSPASSASPQSSKYESQRQPFQIRHLQQIVCHSATSKNSSRYKCRQQILTQQSAGENEESLNQNGTYCNDTFQQIVLTTEQNQDDDDNNNTNQKSKKRNYSTPFSQNCRKPIYNDYSPINSKQMQMNCFFDSSKGYSYGYETTSASSKPSQDESIRQITQNYSYNQSSKNKSSNTAVLYKNRKINEGSIDVSINSSYHNQLISSDIKQFSIKQSQDNKQNLLRQQELNISSTEFYQKSQHSSNDIQIQPKFPENQNQQNNLCKQNLIKQSQEYQEKYQDQTKKNMLLNFSYLENKNEIKSCQNANRQPFLFKQNQFNQPISSTTLEYNSIATNNNDNIQKIQQQKTQNNQYIYSQNLQQKYEQTQQSQQQVQQQQLQQQQIQQLQIKQQQSHLQQIQQHPSQQYHQQQNQDQQIRQQQLYQEKQHQQSIQNTQNQQLQNFQSQQNQQQQRLKLLNQQNQDIIFNNVDHQQKNINLSNINTPPNNDKFQPYKNQQNPKITQVQSTDKTDCKKLPILNDQPKFSNEQQYPIIYNSQSPMNLQSLQQNYCFEPITPMINIQNIHLQPQSSGGISLLGVQATNKSIPIESLTPKKNSTTQLISTINHHSNLQINKSINEQNQNEQRKMSNGKNFIKKYSDTCEYIDNISTLETGSEVGIKQLGPSQTMDIFDTLSTDESVQTHIQGVSLALKQNYINRKMEIQNMQLKSQQQKSKNSNESFPQQFQTNSHQNQLNNNNNIDINNKSTTPNNRNNNNNNTDFTRNFSQKLFN